MNATTPKSGRTPRLAVALTDDTRNWVERIATWTDDPPAATAATLLSAMSHMLTDELRRIPLTVSEVDVLASVIGNDFQTGVAVGGLRTFAQVSEAFDLAHQTPGGLSSYAYQFGIDENDLLTRLRRLGPSADLALRIALAQSWDYQTSDTTDAGAGPLDPAQAYRNAGLTIIDTPEVPAP